MNKFQGTITEIESFDQLSLVKVMVSENVLSAIVVDTPENAPYLEKGKKINVLFNETEVVIGKGPSLSVSLRNRIPGTIQNIEKGHLLSRIVLETSCGQVASVITTNAVEQLALSVGEEVVAMIKTNEMMLGE